MKLLPGYRSRTDQPHIYTFCNQQARSSIASERPSRPDLAYCGYGQGMAAVTSDLLLCCASSCTMQQSSPVAGRG